jgi:hypothetical protein
MPHQTSGVNEAERAVVVVPSVPQLGAQTARAASAAVTVPFAYNSNGKAGGP